MPDAELASRLHKKFYADKIDFDTFADKFEVTIGPQERGFFDKIGEAYTRGRAGTLADVAVYEAAAKGLGDEDTALRIRKDLQYEEAVDPISDSFLGDMVYGGARIMGQWGQSLKRGGPVGVVLGGLGAGIGLGVGVLIPTIGEEPLTAGAGAMIGLKAGVKLGLAEGAALFMHKQGAGAMYANMLEQGVPKEKALKIAGIFAIPYALVEVVQAGQFIKLGGKAAKKALQEATKRTSTDIIKRLGLGYLKALGTQVGEEELQEIIQIAAEDTAQVYGGYGIDVDATYLEQRMHRILITARESAKAMALLPVPGAAWNASIELGVAQNLMEEDAVESMKHEGYKSSIGEEEFARLGQDQQDAVAGAMDDLGLELDEAVQMVQDFQTPDLGLVGMDDRVIADNVTDATEAIDPLQDTGEIIGLSEASMLKSGWKKTSDWVHNYGIRHMRIRNILQGIDSTLYPEAEDKSWKGVLNNLIWKPLRSATSLGATNRIMAINNFRQAIDDSGLTVDELFDKGKKAKYVVEIDGQKFSATEALEVYLAQFDEGKLRHLQVGNKMTTEQMNKVLTKMDTKIADLGNWMLGEYADGYESVAKVYNAVTGKTLPQIDGYSRIFVQEKGRQKTVAYEDLLMSELDRRGFHKRDVKKGMIKKRTKSVVPLRLDAATNFFNNAMQAEWYKAVAPQALKVGKIFNNAEFQKRVDAKTHGVGSQILSKWLQDISSERTTLETTFFGNMMNVLRQHSVVASLGFNVLSMMRQPLSTSIAMAENPRLITRIIANFARDFTGQSEAIRKMVWGKSPQMRTRSIEREIRNMARRKDARAVLGRDIKLSEVSLGGIKFMDQHTVNVVWKSAYELAIDDGMNEQDAIGYADGVIEKTQPMADIMDLPAFFRGSTFEKAFSTFQNQINQNINYWREDIIG
ncbi:hypothetical protein LCGC14_1702970, partial [marine sediment metagenome]|nr:hypothetical protein [Pricia sp.]